MYRIASRSRINLRGLAIVLAGIAAWTSANAQAPGDDGADSEILEVIVTARKRVELLADVPLSIAAINPDQLRDAGAIDLSGLIRNTAGFSFLDHGPTGSRGGVQRLTVRGVAPLPGAGDTVAGYFDETPLNQNDIPLFDIERVEMARGPQGTFYGASAMAGLYKVVPKAPQLGQFSATLMAELGSTQHGGENFGGQFSLNFPLGENVAARIAVMRREDSGFVDRLSPIGPNTFETNDNYNDSDRTVVRASLLAAINERTDVSLMLMQQNARAQGFQSADLETLSTAALIDEPSQAKLSLASIKAEWRGEDLNLVAAASYLKDRRYQINDSSSFLQAIIPPAPPSSGRQDQDFESVTLETRLTGQRAESFNWLLGAYYSSGDGAVTNLDVAPGLGGLLEAIFGEPVPSGDVVFESDLPQDGSELGLFGEARFALSDGRWIATLAGRAYETRSSFQQRSGGLFGGPGIWEGARGSTSGFSPRASIEFKPNNQLTTYLSAARGFRPGGANLQVPAFCGPDLAALGLTRAPSEFDSDSLWTYELGVKAEFADSRVQLATSVYRIDWTDAQQIQILPRCGGAFVSNAGEVTSEGFEIEARLQPIANLQLSLGVAYTDPKFAVDSPSFGVRKGDRVDTSEDWQFNAQFHYSHAFANEVSGFLRGSYQYSGLGTFGTQYPPVVARKEPYSVANAELGLRHENYELSLFVDNATNERPVLRPDPYPDRLQAFTLRPRTIGLRIGMSF